MGIKLFNELPSWVLPCNYFLAFSDSNQSLEHLLARVAWHLLVWGLRHKARIDLLLTELSAQTVEAEGHDNVLVRHSDDVHSFEI